ncbi:MULTISPECIES: hypothetical protein [Streptomyces]|uniref:hypothetical protein n=1 Tax=Streptomyces TaxID=1883 RepID=UPI0005BE5EA5|nr:MULTISPECIES: hypothetical protein [Streptomyces]MDP9954322.1 hypothetical protein [Streptomyces sp. DSM 41269]
MSRKQIAAAMMLALVVVLTWSLVMAAMGHAALIAGLAPVLGLTVTQVLSGNRARTTPTSGRRVAAVPDDEDGTL